MQVPEPALDQVSLALMHSGQFTFVERDFTARGSAVVPNDPNFASQWYLLKIQAPDAWATTVGSAASTIAIVDSGVDSTHPDLSSKLVPGWSFLTGTANTADVLGHGTAVAGVAAAASNNGIGVAGVAWGNMIMPLVVLDSSDYATYSNIANAITYAADRGVRIINVSIGGSSASSTLQSAVDYAWNKGAVVFASAMNNSTSTPYYPAACNNAIAISATDSNDSLASFSNFGSWVDISAPGTNILTTTNGGGYGYWSGTSFSSPITAGVAGLVLSLKGGLSNSALVSLLEQNADDLGAIGFDSYFGYGRVNAYRSVRSAQSSTADTTVPVVSLSAPVNGSIVSGTLLVQGTASDNVGVTNVQFYLDGQAAGSSTATSAFAFSWNTVGVLNGNHILSVKASDAAGNIGSASVSVTVNNPTVQDTIAPIVSIQSPISGASVTTVSGTVQIAASATDNVAVSQVSFYIDGTIKCTDTTSPYTCNWNTKKAAPGAHTIQITAWDAAGNLSSATETVYK